MGVLVMLFGMALFFSLMLAVAFGAAAGAAVSHAGVRRVGGVVLGGSALLVFLFLFAATARVSTSESRSFRQPLPVVEESGFRQASWKFPPAPQEVPPPIVVQPETLHIEPEWGADETIRVETAPAAKAETAPAARVERAPAAPAKVGRDDHDRNHGRGGRDDHAATQTPGQAAAWSDAPEGQRPAWVDQNPGRQQGVFSKTVHSGLFSTKEEASQDLTQQVEQALREQLIWNGAKVPEEWIPRPETVRAAVAAVWCEPLASERLGATVYRLHAQTRFPDHVLTSAQADVRREVGRERSEGVRKFGLWALGGLGLMWLSVRGCRRRDRRPWLAEAKA